MLGTFPKRVTRGQAADAGLPTQPDARDTILLV
jgi:hypothetical protein